MIATKYVYGKYSNKDKVGNLTDEQIDALDETYRHLNTNNLVDAEGNTYKYGTGYIFTEDNVSVRPYIAYGDDMQDAASDKYRFKYEISKGKAALLGFDTSEGYTVPENIDMVIDKAVEYPVTSVAAGAFADNTTAVRTLDVKASVTSIEANAFSNSTSLVYANIPSETTVDKTAFSNITSPIVAGAAGKDSKNNDYILGFNVNPLTHKAKLNGFYLTTIGGTTYGAPYLADLAIPSNIPLDSEHSDMIFEVNEIAADAFRSGRYSNGNETKTADNWLLKCRVPSTVTSIGTNAFDSQIYMASVLIENGDKPLTLGSALFKTCQRLGTVVLPSRISALNYGEMFANTHRLQNIVINGNISEGIASNIADMIKTASGSRDTTYDTKVHVIVNDNTYNLLKAKLNPADDGSFKTITDAPHQAKTMYLENIGGGAVAYLGRTNADNKNRDYINVAAPDNFNNAKLILAKYSSGSEPQQLAVKVIDVSEALKNDGLYQLCISATYNDGTFYKADGTPLTDVTYKVFLWENDFSSCKPVCKLTEWTSAGVVK